MTTKGERTRQEIVERALALANELGLEALSLGVLAAGLQLSKSGLFAHFQSKEALQLEVVHEAIERFSQSVVRPAIAAPRGEPRVRAMFEGFLSWIDAGERKGGCFFMALSHEYDDRPGAVRDLLVQSQQEWREIIGKAARLAKDEKHFGSQVDTAQFAYEMVGIGMAYQQAFKLLSDPRARDRAHAAFDALVARSRRANAARKPARKTPRKPARTPARKGASR
jgi:AcrR family transcriptional regulator